ARGRSARRGSRSRERRRGSGSAPTRAARPRRVPRTRSGPRRGRLRARAGSAREASPALRARSPHGRPRAAAPPDAAPAWPAPARRGPTAREAGRRPVRSPRRPRAAGPGAELSRAPPRGPRARLPSRARKRAGSYFNNYRKNHGPSTRAVIDQLPEAVVQVLLEQLDLDHVVLDELAQDAVCLLAHLCQ